MANTLVGTIHKVGEVLQKTPTFRLREVILAIDPAETQARGHIALTMYNGNVRMAEGLKPGDTVAATFVVGGRKGKDKYAGRVFNRLMAISFRPSPPLTPQATGTVHSLGPEQRKTDRFAFRELVLAVDMPNTQWPEYYRLQFVNADMDLLEGLAAGDRVSVGYLVRGRKWTDANGGEHFANNLRAVSLVREQ